MINTTQAVQKLFMDGNRQVMRATLSSTAGRASTVHDDGSIYTLDGLVSDTGSIVDEFFFPVWGEVITTEIYSDIEITQADIVEGGLTIDSYSMSGSRIEIGAAIASELNLSLRNTDGRFDTTNFDGIEIHVELGVKDWSTDDPINWIEMGYFLTDKSPSRKSVIKLTALDRMTRFDERVDWSLYAFPMSLQAMVERTCNICRMPLATDLTALPNHLYLITMPYTETAVSYRNLIQWAAFLTGTCAQINQGGELVFRWYTPSGFALKAANRYSHEIDDKDITITGIRYATTDETFAVGDNAYPLDYSGCGILQDFHDVILSAIWDSLRGFSYRPFEATIQSAPFLQPLDIVSYEDSKGTYNCIVSHITYTMNRGTPISGTGQSAVDASYSELSGLTREQAKAVDDASKTATNYLSRDSSGIMIADMSSGSTYTPSEAPAGVKNTFIDADSFDVRDGTTTLASFGEVSKIGAAGKGTLEFSNSGMSILAPNGVLITRIGTLNTNEGALAQVNYYQNAVPIQAVTVNNTIVRIKEIVKQSDTSVAIDVPYTVSGNTITFESAITELFIIRFFTSDLLTSFTIGTTESGYGRGIDSVTIGRVNAATMDYSTAVGHHLHALAGNQFVFGRYNEDDASGKYIFIFGNGTSSSERKNAMCIKKSDNTLLMALDTNAAADTDDGELTAVLGDLGILSNVIE